MPPGAPTATPEAAPLELVATCALGLEELLAAELAGLGLGGRQQRGAVTFRGDWQDVWRCNWRLATANRVLVVLAGWAAASNEALTAGARRLVEERERSWGSLRGDELFQPHRSLALRATASASRIRDVRWVALKVKDGLVDGQRSRFGRRASIDRRDPDLPLRVRLDRDYATLLLDTSGEPLDRRGYRVQTTTAPVREQVAAACVLASGWAGQGPVVDPMCGSGTLLAEAASWALGRAPGSLRSGWSFERLPNFEPARFRSVRAEAIPAPGPDVRLFGVDRSREAVEAARRNLTAAGLSDRATLRSGDGFAFSPPPGPGLVLVNPPHGGRLEQPHQQWRRLGDLLKRQYTGWKAVVLAGDPARGKQIGLKPAFRLPIRHGPLDARILGFDLY